MQSLGGYDTHPPKLSKKRTRRPSGSPSCPLPSPSPDGSMERQPPEYQQSGLPSPYPSHGDNQSEASPADQTPVTPYAGQQQEVRPTAYSASATPTSEYGVYPTSSRSGSFPEHIPRSYHPANHTAGGSGDPSIAAPSPTYGHGQYPPYAAPSQDMAHGYHAAGQGLYPQARPDWSGYQQSPAGPLTPTHHVFPQTPNSAHPNRPAQVYSFVPLPGAQQHKRPRRRYEEIERMYKCGYNGCQKAYGTLNHLNAHVTMQSHGAKRTPDEFKEIRREWKARKKEEEARKAAEDRQRQATAAHNGVADPQAAADGAQPATSYASARSVQLPPLGYQATQYPAQQQPQPMGEFHNNHMYHPNYSPSSPYPPSNQYNQHNGNQQAPPPNQ